MDVPTIQDVVRARRTLAPYLRPTPVLSTPSLDRLLGCSAFVKCENLNPTGTFKVRGGINLVANLSLDERQRGVIVSSTGNHGQSVAYAGRLFGVPVIIGAPQQANPFKVQAMRDLGAEVVLVGRDFDEAREWVERTAVEKGYQTRVPFELTMRILWDRLDDFVLVSERALEEAIVLMAETTHQLAEGAGAAPLAAALRLRDQLAGRRIALILSGGNITLESFREILSRAPSPPGSTVGTRPSPRS